MKLRGALAFPAPDRDEVQNSIRWKWDCIGPNVQPEELNAGGKAIPSYSKNRGNGTGRINYLFIHPKKKQRLWACSPTGGMWYTKNGGEKWLEGGTDKLKISGVSSVAVNSKNPHQWVISTGDGDDQFMHSNGIWRTFNSGRTYECINGDDPSTALPFNTSDEKGFISEVVSSPADFNVLFTATSKGFWMCEDARKKSIKKWKRIETGNFYDIEIIDRNDPELDIVIAAGEKFVISYDGGANWEVIPLPYIKDSDHFPFRRLSLEYSPMLPNFLFVAITLSEQWASSPAGDASLQLFDIKTKKWSVVRSLSEGMCNALHTRARAFAVSPTDPQLLMVGNVQPLYRSVDGGLNFSKIEKNQMHDDCHHIEFSSDGKTVWASHDGGVSVSYDQGLTWKNKDTGIGASNVFGLSVAQIKEVQVLYGGYDIGSNLLRDHKWYHVSWGDGFESVTHPQNPDIMFSTMQNGGIKKSTSGINFEEGKNPNARTEWHTWIRMNPQVNNTIYMSGSMLMRSNDLGEKWETIMNVRKTDSTLYNAYKFFLSEKHPNVMYVYCLDEKTKVNPQIWRTFNLLEGDPSRIVWERVQTPGLAGWIAGIAVDESDPHQFNLLYAHSESTGKFWYYNGSSYEDRTFNMGHSSCESIVTQKGGRLYVGGTYGVFTMKPGESEWTLMTGLPGTFIKSMAINYASNKLVVGTFGRGLWMGDLWKN
ncbi:MAG: WD40/YVTN/BNR-like repeat-containing protein [Flavobacteriales bacterium]